LIEYVEVIKTLNLKTQIAFDEVISEKLKSKLPIMLKPVIRERDGGRAKTW
jgi:hypothetical protein